MDRLTYTYRSGTNQLWSVQDGIAAGAYAGDIDNQGGSNYSYDRIGNLIGDVSENINQVNWTVYGKIGNIRKKQAFLGYVYNAGGERVVKQYLPYATNQCADCPPGTGIDDLEVYERNSATPEIYKARKTITFLSEYTDERYRDYSAIIEAGLAICTPQCNVQPPLNTSDADIYIRDATGNVLAVYHYDRKTSQLRWSEQHLYGSARLGMYLPEKSVISVSTDSKQREVGYVGKQIFELSNHLGNVLATITDKKLQVSTNTTSTAYFEAEVQTVQDYYAFGMQMPGRKLSGGCRYGFNGKENDNEVKGEGNQQDYGMRMYDGRIGKFLSVDPLTKQYPELTPYQFASNSPIFAIDRDGLEMFGNNWLFDIWLEWKFGDPTGIKTLKTGLEDKAAVQLQQNTYHSNVPQPIESRLDHINNVQANLKIAAGTSKVIAFNIKTSFDVISTVAPIGEGISVAFKGAEIMYGGIKAERVLIGSSEKIAVIGREFDKRVVKFASEFEKQTGKTIETFQASNAAKAEWSQLLKKYGGNISDDIARQSQIFKENLLWAEKIKNEGYKVFDTGLGAKDAKGTFYGMETKTIFGDKK
jgi:RHS repeat-associated protein